MTGPAPGLVAGPGTGRPPSPPARAADDGRVPLPSGARVDPATAAEWAAAPPPNTLRARTSRQAVYVRWCQQRGRIATDAGTLLDYLAHLARLGHPPETLSAYLGPLTAAFGRSGHPLPDEVLAEARALIAGHARRTAGDPEAEGDPLQTTPAGEREIRAQLATLDRTTVRGTRDAVALLLAWHIGARASEPGSIQNRDVTEESAPLTDPRTGRTARVPVLVIRIRLSKTNAYGRSTDVIRVMAEPDAELCLVAAARAWRRLLAEIGEEHTGLFLRGVGPDGRIATRERPGRGRPPTDPHRRGGFGDRAMRDLIARTAREAGLTQPPTPDERALLSTTAETVAVRDLPPDEAEQTAANLRRRRRALRRARARYSGHSARRGQARRLQARGVPRHLIERQLRYVPGSTALARYLDPLVADQENPTRPDPSALADAWWAPS